MKKIRNLINILLIISLILIPSQIYGQESEFETFDTVVELDGKKYEGFLLSDKEYDRYVRLDLEYNSLSERYKIISDYNDFIEDKFKDLETTIYKSFIEIQKNATIEETWWDNNKDWVFITGGIFLGLGAGYLIFKE